MYCPCCCTTSRRGKSLHRTCVPTILPASYNSHHSKSNSKRYFTPTWLKLTLTYVPVLVYLAPLSRDASWSEHARRARLGQETARLKRQNPPRGECTVAWPAAGARTPTQAIQHTSAGCQWSALCTHEHRGADTAAVAGADRRLHAVAQVLRVIVVWCQTKRGCGSRAYHVVSRRLR